MPLTLPFDSSDSTLALAGGKGMNLSALARVGFPVPPGFIVTTEAYRAFVETNQIQDRLLALVKSIAPDDPVALDSASADIAALFTGGTIPQAIADSITLSYLTLSSLPSTLHSAVAVRSSATAEDLPGLSFAGQQDTYLNIVGVDSVLLAVKKCWASLWTARAIGYRARNHIAPDTVTLAVVVQQLIASDSSGVLFTANPLTGRRAEMVIDASFGLGEAIVQGIVEPDHYQVDSTNWTITQRKIGAKALAIRPRAGGGTDELKQDVATQQALPDEQILALCRLAQRVADHYQAPQDIEWAWANGQLYLLQSRPITSLYPLPAVPTPADKLGVFFSFASIQGVNDPLTPLGRDVMRFVLGGVFNRVLKAKVDMRQGLVDAGERLYLNFTHVAHDPQLRAVMMAGLQRADPPAKQVIVKLVEEGRLPTSQTQHHGPPPALLRVAPRVLPRVVFALLAPQIALARAYTNTENSLKWIQVRAQVAGSSLAGLLTVIEFDLSRTFESTVIAFLPAIFPAIGFLVLLDRWLIEWSGAQPGAALALMRGLPHNVTTEMNLKLWAAAQTIRADEPSRAAMQQGAIAELIAHYQKNDLPAVAQREIKKFLDEYGMRAVAEIDLGRLRWRDEPSSVFQTLQSYLNLTDPDSAPDAVFRRGTVEAERLAADWIARARRSSPLGFWRAAWLSFVIDRMRVLAGARETPKFYMIKALDHFRTLLLDRARDLVSQNQLERAEDIFFVPFETLKQFASGNTVDLKEVVAHNRAAAQLEQPRRQLPRILLSTGEAFYQGVTSSEIGPNDLVGEAVSPGMAEGVVRVVLDPRGTRLEPGEILVCPATDPGWTPLFLAAGGLVMEIGGMVTHGSVVAREYGIPAVVGVDSCTTRLKTGQRVRVDGNSGRVTILD